MVWITYYAPDDCMCWRDTICTHGWTWQERNPPCRHYESYDEIHESLADAIRDLFSVRGAKDIGCLLRDRFTDSTKTHNVYVMPAGAEPFIDDHDVYEGDGPTPRWIISRYDIQTKTTARNDPEGHRAFAELYRDQ